MIPNEFYHKIDSIETRYYNQYIVGVSLHFYLKLDQFWGWLNEY